MAKFILTIAEILNRYYYKEWIQNDLKQIGESTSGDKEELIARYLNSDRIRKNDVQATAMNLISSLRSQELKQILHDYNIKNGKQKTGLIDKISHSFDFEPYVLEIKRYCGTCHIKTDQTVHYSNDWKANYYNCSVCNNDEMVPKSDEIPERKNKFDNRTYSDAMIFLRSHYWHTLGIFTTIFIPLGVSYGWIEGFIISVLVTSLIVFIWSLVHRQGIQ